VLLTVVCVHARISHTAYIPKVRMLGGVLLARLGRGSLLGRDLEPAGERGVHLVRKELLRLLLALLPG